MWTQTIFLVERRLVTICLPDKYSYSSPSWEVTKVDAKDHGLINGEIVRGVQVRGNAQASAKWGEKRYV